MSNSNNPKHILYQVHCGRWKQANVVDHPGKVLHQLLTFNWKHLKERIGVTHVYFLGLWQNEGKIVVNEEAGIDLTTHPYRSPSPFALTDHTVINPDLGTALDMDRLLTCLHGLGIKVLVDFVPNHTGLFHSWLSTHPDYYQHTADGSIQTGFSGDVAVLDYANGELCQEMKRILSHIASFGFDGVRCDMAHLIPMTFWHEAITEVKSHFAAFIWIAEAYGSSVFDLSVHTMLIDAGFDAIYDEPLYRNLKTSDTFEKGAHFMGHYDYVINNYPDKWIHYLSNHDDNFPLPYGQFSVWFRLMSLLPGWLFIYNGSLWGRSQRLAHHWAEVLPEDQTLVETLSSEYISWFSWLHREQPHVVDTQVGNVVKVCWQGVSRKGLAWFNLTAERQAVPDSTTSIDPYQVLVESL